jgi:phosphate:Na+ symporter
VATVPSVALETAARTVEEITAVVLHALKTSLAPPMRNRHGEELLSADDALRSTRRFLALLRTSPDTAAEYRRHLDLLHTMDHVDNLVELARSLRGSSTAAAGDPVLGLAARLGEVIAASTAKIDQETASVAGELAGQLTTIRLNERKIILERTALGEIDPEEADAQLEMLRWLERVSHHVARASFYISGGNGRIEAMTTPREDGAD